jgi:hypothetical protein
VFLCIVGKLSDLFLEQRINIKFCVTLGKNESDTCVILSEAYGREDMKSQVFLGGINSSKRVHILKSQMKRMLISSFHFKVIVQF